MNAFTGMCMSFILFNQCILGITYADAGVSIERGDSLVDRIAPLAKATARPGADGQLGGFSSIFDLKKTSYADPIIFCTTDGVGTKLKLAIALNIHDTVGTDLVAMCVNDLIVHGAEPTMFLDYFATSKLNVDQATAVIAGIARACLEAGCTLAGGETAEMPSMYAPGDYNLAGFAVGVAERSHILPKRDAIMPGDVVIGIASSGIHSNGFSLVRHIIEKNGISLSGKPPFPSDYATLGQALLTPTIIYVKPLLPLIQAGFVKALAHITGGGLLDNVPRVLPDHCAVEIYTNAWEVPPVFTWLADVGHITKDEMMHTFNMGIGMVVIAAAENVDTICNHLKSVGQKPSVIGSVIIIPENKKQVVLKN